jgi:hypothetical protein
MELREVMADLNVTPAQVVLLRDVGWLTCAFQQGRYRYDVKKVKALKLMQAMFHPKVPRKERAVQVRKAMEEFRLSQQA